MAGRSGPNARTWSKRSVRTVFRKPRADGSTHWRCELMSALAITNCTITATRSITNQPWCSGSAIRRPGAISRPPMIPAICVTGWPRITSSRRSRAATAPSYRTSPAQKVDVLHKKLSLNGALCAKPPRGDLSKCSNVREQSCGYSITSSATDSSDDGTVRPSIVAVWALITNSNLADCTTGRSAGMVPLRIRPA